MLVSFAKVKERSVSHASVLYEVPHEGGDQEPEVDQDEERQARDSGRLPEVRHQSVQNRQRVENVASPG